MAKKKEDAEEVVEEVKADATETVNDANEEKFETKKLDSLAIGEKIGAEESEEASVESEYEVVEAKQEPEYEQVEAKKEKVREGSYFDGGVLELIGWKILAFLVTGVTLGLATPWAKCMLYNYRFKHTVYNGKRLKFNGTGGDLFVNMFKWIFLTLITFGIYGFFVPVRKAQWVVSNLQYDDEEFVKGDSFFDGKTIQYIGISILNYFIIVLSLGLLTPLAECIEMNWICKHSVISKKKLIFEGKAIGLFGYRILWALATIITFGIFGLWVPIFEMDWFAKRTRIKTTNDEYKTDKSLFIAIPIIVIAMILISTVFGLLGTLFGSLGLAKFMVDEGIVSSSQEAEEIVSNPFKLIGTFIIQFNPITAVKYNKTRNDSAMMRERTLELEEKQNADLYMSKNNKTTYQNYDPEPDPEPEPEPEPEPTSTVIGGYTVNYGTYSGTIEQGIWDDTTMTASSRKIKVNIVLTASTITVDGTTYSYSTSGKNIVWNGDYYTLEVVGNNQIRYNVETCPTLTWQGY